MILDSGNGICKGPVVRGCMIQKSQREEAVVTGVRRAGWEGGALV